jgi:endonuclease III
LIAQREAVHSLLKKYGGKYSTSMGIDLSKCDSREIFKWFLASILFGARIGENIAMKTYAQFLKEDVVTPERMLEAGWDGLVGALDLGGYVRYDFKTADKLLEVARKLLDIYGGDLNKLHEAARDPRDLEAKVKALGKGVGDVTVNIFLREMREVWVKAKPLPQELVLLGAKAAGLIGRGVQDRKCALNELERVWEESRIPDKNFSDLEAALVRLGKKARKTGIAEHSDDRRR